MDLIKIPNKFFEDFHERYLSTSESYRKKYGIPKIIKKDKTHSWISRQDPNLKELLWDADHISYVDTYPYRALARETVKAIEDHEYDEHGNNIYTLKPCKFSIEDDPIFEGFCDEDYKYWNGWLNPYVTKEVRDQILNFYCPPKVRDKLIEERKTCEDLDVFDNEYPWLEYWNKKADPKTGLYYFGSGFIWEEFEDKTYEVHWKEGYPKCDPKTVSLQELKEDKEGRWNFSAYGEDVLDDISNLEINESLDVVGVTERTTFIRKE